MTGMVNTIASDNAMLKPIQFLDINLEGGTVVSRTSSDN
jgi:hypothetical protein